MDSHLNSYCIFKSQPLNLFNRLWFSNILKSFNVRYFYRSRLKRSFSVKKKRFLGITLFFCLLLALIWVVGIIFPIQIMFPGNADNSRKLYRKTLLDGVFHANLRDNLKFYIVCVYIKNLFCSYLYKFYNPFRLLNICYHRLNS